MEGRKVGERSKSVRDHTDADDLKRELKVEEEDEGPLRENAPVRLKCEAQQDASSSRCMLCAYVSACFHVRRCWRLA